MTLPRLLLLTDRAQLPNGVALVDHVGRCQDAGVTHVILRELDLADPARAALVADLTDLGLIVVAARRPLTGAVGVHEVSTGQGGAAHVRGRSCHSRREVELAAADGCTYATLGPFALTDSKPGYGPAIDPATYVDLPIPTYALGGITPANAKDAVTAGAHGVAVMGAVMRSTDPGRVVRDLMEAIA